MALLLRLHGAEDDVGVASSRQGHRRRWGRGAAASQQSKQATPGPNLGRWWPPAARPRRSEVGACLCVALDGEARSTGSEWEKAPWGNAAWEGAGRGKLTWRWKEDAAAVALSAWSGNHGDMREQGRERDGGREWRGQGRRSRARPRSFLSDEPGRGGGHATSEASECNTRPRTASKVTTLFRNFKIPILPQTYHWNPYFVPL